MFYKHHKITTFVLAFILFSLTSCDVSNGVYLYTSKNININEKLTINQIYEAILKIDNIGYVELGKPAHDPSISEELRYNHITIQSNACRIIIDIQRRPYEGAEKRLNIRCTRMNHVLTETEMNTAKAKVKDIVLALIKNFPDILNKESFIVDIINKPYIYPIITDRTPKHYNIDGEQIKIPNE